MMNVIRILKCLSFYVVLSASCLLIWLVYGFNRSIIEPVESTNEISVMASSDSQLVTATTTDTDHVTVGKPSSHKPLLHHHTVINASCNRLIAGDKAEMSRVKRLRHSKQHGVTDTEYLQGLISNCSHTRLDFTNSFYTSPVEESYPIGYDMLVYYKEQRVQQYIRLLRYLYRPQNIYCIHIDDKSPQWWKDLLKEFTDCFPNIILASNPVVIQYATATILYGHLRCLKDLLRYKWNYVITLHATELPMVTNREIVKLLKTSNGTNFITKGVRADKANSQVKDWIMYKVKSVNNGRWVRLTKRLLDPVPHNITLYKSAASANSALSRGLVEYIFSNPKVQDLVQWLKDVHSAVEFFFSTVNQMPGAPGHSNNNIELAHRIWRHQIRDDRSLCRDMKIVHDICIVSVSDLPMLSQMSTDKKYWFFNKYFIEYDHIVMDCMEELLINRNIKEFHNDYTISLQ